MDKNKLIEYIKSGLSQRKIAELEEKSQATIRYYLDKYNLKTDPHLYNRPDIPDDQKLCSSCNTIKHLTEFHFHHKEKRPISSCKKCSTQRVLIRQQNFKQQCLDYKGGNGCERCGYNKSNVALDFHHRDSTTKDFAISRFKLYKFIDSVKEELDKCDVLCSNCHREVHHELSKMGP